MGVTKYDNINSMTSSAKVVGALPGSARDYYGATEGQDPSHIEWVGGELVYYTISDRLYVQIATSGQTPTWKYLSDAFATTSSSTSTSTSSTSSSTSTSTSTSTSSTSTSSTSTSSTTTP